jgi:hypothetical protein
MRRPTLPAVDATPTVNESTILAAGMPATTPSPADPSISARKG